MKWSIFGLTVSSSWGNGHATLWRGLIHALARLGHEVHFFERDLPFYAEHRDLLELPDRCALHLYPAWADVERLAARHVADSDVAMVTSYCPDGPTASELVFGAQRPTSVFYDMDTPVTLERAQAGERVEYLPEGGLRDFDLVLSYTGGEALVQLRTLLGARLVAPLYGSVDPGVHRPVAPREAYRGDLSYLGTYAANRQAALERLFLEPARRLPERRFVIGGAQYPRDFAWTPNLFFVQHLPPQEHPAFFCSSALTLNVTREPMARMGYCPSGRLFEAAACRVPVLTDVWQGLADFFEPGRELLLARTSEDVVEALSLPREELARLGRRAQERALGEHTADRRAHELVRLVEEAARWRRGQPEAPRPPSSRQHAADAGEDAVVLGV